jgi:hypothetical protein
MFAYCVILTTIAASAFQSDAAGFQQSQQQILSLSPPEQRNFIAKVFEKRITQARNFRFTARQSFANRSWKDGTVGEPIPGVGFRRLLNYHRYEHAYKLETQMFRYEEQDWASAVQVATSAYNLKSGEGRAVFSRPAKSILSGRICTRNDRVVDDARYVFWLSGEHPTPGAYLFQMLLAQKEEWQIAVGSKANLIRLRCPWSPYEGWTGEKDIELDCDRGLMPVFCKGRSQSGDNWRIENFEVFESKLVGDVFMPTRMRELVSGNVLGPNVVTAYDTDIMDMSAGDVKKEDADLVFPEGTEVVNEIEGTGYHVGPDGKPVGAVTKLIGATSAVALASAKKTGRPSRWTSLIAINAIAFCGLVAYLRRRQRASRRT